ncbi:MAG: hypothetical protein Q6362_004815 [Candidatus Wukongarchaeota archaeon]|nr:hypothetical protein [Candidatus Wukongarchaeota archaeon]
MSQKERTSSSSGRRRRRKEEKQHITISLPESIANKFREKAYALFGLGKGSLSEAAEEAITDWLEKVEKEEAGG